MKQYRVVIVSFMLGFFGCSLDLETQLQGTWQLASVDGKEVSEARKRDIIAFKKGGFCSAREQGKKIPSCRWQVNREGTQLTISVEGDETVFDILEFEARTIKLVVQGRKMTAILKKQ